MRKDLWTTNSTAPPPDEGNEAEKQRTPAVCTNVPRVRFEKEAIMRKYLIGSIIGEQYVEKPIVTVLSDDRKRTAGKFKGKKTRFEVQSPASTS